jgi:hypothetical protein
MATPMSRLRSAGACGFMALTVMASPSFPTQSDQRRARSANASTETASVLAVSDLGVLCRRGQTIAIDSVAGTTDMKSLRPVRGAPQITISPSERQEIASLQPCRVVWADSGYDRVAKGVTHVIVSRYHARVYGHRRMWLTVILPYDDDAILLFIETARRNDGRWSATVRSTKQG